MTTIPTTGLQDGDLEWLRGYRDLCEPDEQLYQRLDRILAALRSPSASGVGGLVSDDDFETLGQMVDKLDNFAHGALLPISLETHKAALTACIEDVLRDELKAWLTAKGFNPWSDE